MAKPRKWALERLQKEAQKLWQERMILSFIGAAPMPPPHKFFRLHWAQNADSEGEF